jgi:hypothetical protein
MRPLLSMRAALEDHDLLGLAVEGPSWCSMVALCVAAFGEPLNDNEREIFTLLTGRAHEPLKRVRRFVVVAGRRSGKSYIAACCGIYLAVLCDHSDNLNVGEKGIVLCIAENVEQAKVVFDYAVGIAEASPVISKEIVQVKRNAIVFRNGIEIQVRASSSRGLRGLTLVGCVCDEVAAWYRTSGPTADKEVFTAVTPALMTTKGMLIIISTPRPRAGVLWDLYSKNYGPNGPPDTLVAQGATTLFNTTIDPAEIEAAIADDPTENTAEYLATFRSDLESFIQREVIEACVVPQRYMLPFQQRYEGDYIAFTDPSSGRADEMTLAIMHPEKRKTSSGEEDFVCVLDYLRGAVAFTSPDALVAEFCETMKEYRVNEVYGDNYAAAFAQELFNKNGITYRLSELNKGQIYSQVIPVLNSPGRVELLDDRKMVDQFVMLERRTGRSTGRDSIDHPPGAHDDRSNAVAGALQLTASGQIGSSSVWLRL